MKLLSILLVLCAACEVAEHDPIPALDAAPIQSAVTKWRAAHLIAMLACQADGSKEDCQFNLAQSWCPDASTAGCGLPVADMELFDHCLAATEPRAVPSECWSLFR